MAGELNRSSVAAMGSGPRPRSAGRWRFNILQQDHNLPATCRSATAVLNEDGTKTKLAAQLT